MSSVKCSLVVNNLFGNSLKLTKKKKLFFFLAAPAVKSRGSGRILGAQAPLAHCQRNFLAIYNLNQSYNKLISLVYLM